MIPHCTDRGCPPSPFPRTRTGGLPAALLVGILSVIPFHPLPAQAHQGEDVRLAAVFGPEYVVGGLGGRGDDLDPLQVDDVGLDEDGRLYVLDHADGEIRVFDATGAEIRRFGRNGRGPGELSGSPLTRIAVGRSGRVWISDPGNRALLLFERDGRLAAQHRFPNHWLVPESLEPAAGDLLAEVATGPGSADGLYLFRSSEPASPILLATARHRPGTAFSPDLRFAALPGGRVAVAAKATYEIRILDHEGALLRVIGRPVPPAAVTDRDRVRARERHLDRLNGDLRIVGNGRTGKLPSGLRRDVRNALSDIAFADVRPVIRRLEVDGEGRLWVERELTGTDRRGGDPVTGLDVFGPDLIYRGTAPQVEMPTVFGHRQLVAFVDEDDLGVRSVRVGRLSPDR